MVIKTEKLTKLYENGKGCKEITLTVNKGEIFALLGPNGAGKSTFIKTLVGLIFKTSGEAFVLCKPIGDVYTRKNIGYLPDNFKYQDWMTGEDLLSFHSALYKIEKKEAIKKITEVLELVKLKGSEKYKIGTYSKGMQQRIGIASALLSNPELIFLDEPTSALDPIGRKEVREIIIELKNMKKTVLLNSHLLSEVEMVCDSAAIINKGLIVKMGRMEEILEGDSLLELQVDKINDILLNRLFNIDDNLSFKDNTIQMKINEASMVHDIALITIESGAKIKALTPHKKSLEDIFIGLMEGEKN
jgi:ABC-2 type transport system ATP-binding protein